MPGTRMKERQPRDVTINLRANQRQRALIDRAAETLGKNRSDFMLEAACREASVLLVALPFAPETEAIVSARVLDALGRGYVVNVSRGAVIDQDALVVRLADGRLAGAGLDVTVPEPLPGDSPLWTLENVLITPHTAGLTSRMWERHYAHFSANLRRYLAGEPVVDVVDKRKGY